MDGPDQNTFQIFVNARLLHSLKYSLQSNRKSLEGKQSEEHNAQFEYINKQVKIFQAENQPVISIDTKKKELIGDFKNAGQEWRPQGQPVKVHVHDFESGKRNKKAIPYGVYDVTWNKGWVNVGMDHNTAEFAVESIRKWWLKMGNSTYSQAGKLLITADSGGSNSSRGRLWKIELQKLADELGLEITVCHLPPGTSGSSGVRMGIWTASKLPRLNQRKRVNIKSILTLFR